MSTPILIAMNARFKTNDDDKDHNTRLDVRLIKSDRTVVAERTGISGTFDDWSTHDFDIKVSGTMTKNDVAGSVSRLNISPVGNDTWKFDYTITLRFSDNTFVERVFKNKALSQEVREGTYPL
jgi:hypothetical protein